MFCYLFGEVVVLLVAVFLKEILVVLIGVGASSDKGFECRLMGGEDCVMWRRIDL